MAPVSWIWAWFGVELLPWPGWLTDETWASSVMFPALYWLPGSTWARIWSPWPSVIDDAVNEILPESPVEAPLTTLAPPVWRLEIVALGPTAIAPASIVRSPPARTLLVSAIVPVTSVGRLEREAAGRPGDHARHRATGLEYEVVVGVRQVENGHKVGVVIGRILDPGERIYRRRYCRCSCR